MLWSWTKSHSKNEVFSIIRWVYVFSRVFGFFPFSVVYDKKRQSSKVQVAIWDAAWFIIAILIYVGIVAHSYCHEYNELPKSFIQRLTAFLTLTASCAIAIYGNLMDMVNRKDIWKIITNFHEFDEMVS